jgi:hypothetical protein
VLAAAAAGTTGDRPAVSEKLGAIALQAVAEIHAVCLVAAILQGNDTLLPQAAGFAYVVWDVPMPVEALFETGSIGRRFTAAAVLMLRDK